MKKLCTTINNVEIDLPVGGRERATGYVSGCFVSVSSLPTDMHFKKHSDTYRNIHMHVHTLRAHTHIQFFNLFVKADEFIQNKEHSIDSMENPLVLYISKVI